MPQGLRYRLALDLGSTSLGWAMIRLNAENAPCAVIKAGVRIFSDGRDPKDGSSLAVTRREARAMRRRRDRLLKRKARMMQTLVVHGFFPKLEAERKSLETLNPYTLRAKGLSEALSPAEFGRALFHINQRRGFKSNRKTDKKDNDSSTLKTAINKLRQDLADTGCRTVGEWLHKRDAAGETVRARYREEKVLKDDGKTRVDKSYDLYIDRAMIEAEFDALWAAQTGFNPSLFNITARDELKDALLFQRSLKPVIPGRCTLLPDEMRAPLALPSTQRFRIYQEVNNLRLLVEGLNQQPLSLAQRDIVVRLLETPQREKKTAHDVSFDQIRSALGISGAFNIEDQKRQSLKGNSTSTELSKRKHFGSAWLTWTDRQQDAIVKQLINQESRSKLIKRLQKYCKVDEANAELIADAGLPDGYGSLSEKALFLIIPKLKQAVQTYDKAVLSAGFGHHSRLDSHGEVPGRTFDTGYTAVDQATGEIKKLHAFKNMPYYGEFLQRRVGFGTGNPEHSEEKRYGKIANPTVHVGLNQVRVVVNALVQRYGHPEEVIVELARDLKLSREDKKAIQDQQAANQARNNSFRKTIAEQLYNDNIDRVKPRDLEKLILWNELSSNEANRKCPYSGQQISRGMLFSPDVEIEHILPFSLTLDDSLNNKTVALRSANRIKGNRSPWDARFDFAAQGWPYAAIVNRAELMPNQKKRARFAEDALKTWLKDENNFLPRALNDTRQLSKVAREYMSLICPQNTRVIPGQMTAMLRRKFGLNDVLGLDGEKNRNDHRHHAVDACVIGVTDQGLLQRFAKASADAREKQLNRLVENMAMPWGDDQDRKYFNSVQLAVSRIWVSHKPDHGYEARLHEETAYRPPYRDPKNMWRTRGIGGAKPNEKKHDTKAIIGMYGKPGVERYTLNKEGVALPYKGYVGGSNYCIEITAGETGKWTGQVTSTHAAYQIVRSQGIESLRHAHIAQNGERLVMRLSIGDGVRLEINGEVRTYRVAYIPGNGQVFMAPLNDANVDARNSDKNDSFAYLSKYAGSLQKAKARRVTISPIGELKDHGFKA